jgi:hypothetical protein
MATDTRPDEDDHGYQRRLLALELARAGASIEQITRRMNYPTIQDCQDDLSLIYSEVLSIPVEEARALDVLRIDRMIMGIWGEARAGTYAAIDRVTKLIDTRAKLLGTYAPIQVEQVTFDSIESEIRRLERELGANVSRVMAHPDARA